MEKKAHKKPEFSHFDGGRARMVDVSRKSAVIRQARARGKIFLSPETVRAIRERLLPKGDVLTVAQIAGISGAKRTAELIPLCHPIPLGFVDVQLRLEEDGIAAESVVRTAWQTGVEMEALTAVSVALLTVYDMCKSTDSQMRIGDIYLVEKSKTEIGGTGD